jgi:sensor histidine kinase YesM
MSFSTADLGSTTERIYEYRINNGNWNTTMIEKIELYQLGSGTYKVQIRAINRDGIPSNKTEVVTFKIKTPLKKSPWFWTIVGLAIGAIILYFTQRINKVKRERTVQKLLTEKKLSELELKALKAQINPHFVFNCLNSIKYLNHQKRFAETDIYLDKFSYLLRKTLDFSGLQKIPLEEELAYSRNYLELEKLRLGDKLDYEIKLDSKIDIQTLLVPPMLFQPYLENAIKHGIRHLVGKSGHVLIDIKQIENSIVCIIADNGVGIDNAKAINAKDNPKHQSHGTTLQQRRADLYNVAVNTSIGEDGNGTIVTLTLQNE